MRLSSIWWLVPSIALIPACSKPADKAAPSTSKAK